jgi:D-alanyl-D-alanine carboxypeptidase
MLRAGSRTAIHACVWGLISILAMLAATPADARRHASTHRGHARAHASHHSSGDYSPRYSAIVVDANSGATLHESSPDGLRHPASLTKIMTLYMLFEQLNAGKLTLESKIEVSEHAASQSPTKLGVPAGGSINVEDAIKAVVTRSANDIACAIGEKLGGDEDTFAQMMTKKAHALGMIQTIYRNASGLPNDEQVTSARDQALLGRAIQERFPRYYRYFSTRSFTWHGHEIANHNHLLGSVEGVDGIKTGFVHASGFNLVTSVRRNGRHLVAVVMGGSSAGSRDARMRELISQYISKGSQQHTAPLIAEGARPPVRAAAKVAPAPDGSMAKTAGAPFVTASAPAAALHAAPAAQSAAATPATAAAEAQPAAPRRTEATVAMVSPTVGSSDDIRPIPVRTLRVRATALKATSIGSEAEAAHAVVPVTPASATPQPEADAVISTTPAPPAVEAAPAPQPPAPDVVSAPVPAPVVKAAAAPPPAAAIAEAREAKAIKAAAVMPAPAPAKPAIVADAAEPQRAPAPTEAAAASAIPEAREAKAIKAAALMPAPAPAKPAIVAEAAEPRRAAASTEATAAPPAHETARDGWVIQVGALESVTAAKERLGSAQSSAAKILKQADPFTEKVVKGDKTLYRARFAGLDKNQAEAACRALKRSDIPCMLVAAASKN